MTEQIKEKIVEQEVLIDFEGENQEPSFERTLIPEDSYNATIKQIEQIELQNFDKTRKEKKLKITIEILDQEKPVELVHFVAPKIMKAATNKGGKIYSNSKLFDMLVDLKLKDTAKEKQEELKTIDGLQLFLSTQLVNKKVRVAVKTSKANTEDAYSVVNKILRFI
jgi:hypothetical protein